jgi:hypothetical protein
VASFQLYESPKSGGLVSSAFRKSATSGVVAVGSAIRWGWHVGPAVAGMAAVSAGVGGIVQTFAGAGGIWVGLVTGGVFAIAIDLKG